MIGNRSRSSLYAHEIDRRQVIVVLENLIGHGCDSTFANQASGMLCHQREGGGAVDLLSDRLEHLLVSDSPVLAR